MKTTTPFLLPAALAALLLAGSCQDYFRQSRTGTLLITLQDPFPAPTRAGEPLPDVGSFRITVTDAAGKVYYDGPYERAPDALPVPAGAYTVSAVSDDFTAPAYDAPQWGDTQVVSVAADADVSVSLSCSQLNCGLRLTVDDNFRKAFPAGTLYLGGADGIGSNMRERECAVHVLFQVFVDGADHLPQAGLELLVFHGGHGAHSPAVDDNLAASV